MVQLVRMVGPLPDGFETLRQEAVAEGHRHMDRLAREWDEDPDLFQPLLATFDGGALVGVGGLTAEPKTSRQPAMRMRRLYVLKSARRQGVARTLVNALLQEALDRVRLVTVNADPRSFPFWEALEFAPVQGCPWTHQFQPYSAA